MGFGRIGWGLGDAFGLVGGCGALLRVVVVVAAVERGSVAVVVVGTKEGERELGLGARRYDLVVEEHH